MATQLTNSTPPKQQVGILGDGQLAQMLATAAKNLGLYSLVLSKDGEGPGTLTADEVVRGTLQDEYVLTGFMTRCSAVAIEQEFPESTAKAPLINSESLYPRFHATTLVSCKLEQKRRLFDHQIPTAPWQEFCGEQSDAASWLASVKSRFTNGAVLKVARGGYDGRGTFIIKNYSEPRLNAAKEFIFQAQRDQVALYAEELIPFSQEIAAITVRSKTGSHCAYPVVETVQDQGICLEVRGDASDFTVSQNIAETALAYALKIGEIFNLYGTYGVEFFVSNDHGLLVNEIAPRVHNSGHFSLDAAKSSQFENHWRALLGLPLGDTSTPPFFGMVNILGPEHYSGPITPPAIKNPNVFLHWYGKKESRPRRKIGHFNIIANSKEELESLFNIVNSQIHAWAKATET